MFFFMNDIFLFYSFFSHSQSCLNRYIKIQIIQVCCIGHSLLVYNIHMLCIRMRSIPQLLCI